MGKKLFRFMLSLMLVLVSFGTFADFSVKADEIGTEYPTGGNIDFGSEAKSIRYSPTDKVTSAIYGVYKLSYIDESGEYHHFQLEKVEGSCPTSSSYLYVKRTDDPKKLLGIRWASGTGSLSGEGVEADPMIFAPVYSTFAINLSSSSLSFPVEEVQALTATIDPETPSEQIKWSVTGEAVTLFSDSECTVPIETGTATDTKSVYVKGTAPGTASVTATSTTYDSISATCEVTVNQIPVDYVSLEKGETSIHVGSSEKLEVDFEPENATNKMVSWNSNDEVVATVDDEGKVTAVAPGTAVITVTSQSDESKTDTCTVTVLSNEKHKIHIQEDITNGRVTINSAKEEFDAGDQIYLYAIPDEGFELKKLTVTDSSGEIKVYPYMTSQYHFIMPDADVNVRAEFTKPKQIGIDFGQGHEGDAAAAFNEWNEDGSSIARLTEVGGIQYTEGDHIIYLNVKSDVVFSDLNHGINASLMYIPLSGTPYEVRISDEITENFILGKKELSQYENEGELIQEITPNVTKHMDDIFPSSEDSSVFHFLWGTPIKNFTVNCEPLICGTEFVTDEETGVQRPVTELDYTESESVAIQRFAQWQNMNASDPEEWENFTVNGENKYVLKAGFESKFPNVFTYDTKVTVNGVEAEPAPGSPDKPIFVPIGNTLQIQAAIQAEHDTDEWEVIKEPTVTEEGEEGRYCWWCGEIIESRKIPMITYKVTSGDGQVWTKGGTGTADFEFVRSYENEDEGQTAFDLFTEIEIDGKKVEDFTPERGSVITKVNSSYMNTLSAGTHSITAKFNDGGTATAKFIVKDKSSGGSSGGSSKKPTTPADNVVTCQMAGYPANYSWNEAAKACQPGYIDAGGNFHPYRTAVRTVPNTSDRDIMIHAWIAMLSITIGLFCAVKLLHEDWEV